MALINQKIRLIFLAILITVAIFSFASIAKMQDNASSVSNIQLPVKELGNCNSEADCKSYCNQPQNIEACVNFAEKHNLMSPEEISQAKKFIAAGGKGPGGCTSKDSCESYCNNVSHINECVAFAEKSGILPPQELEEAKKVQAALGKGAKIPGNCQNKKECDAYCGAPEHMEECVAFGEAAGFIPSDELGQAKKMIEALKKGVKPLPCRGKDECDAYCGAAGHFEECVNFSEAAGFMSSEEAMMARKTGGKGPGDCRSKEECDAFCKKPENQETCFNFGKDRGLIPEDQLKQIEEGKQKMKDGLLNAPPEVLNCLTNAFGNEFIEKLKTGTAMPSRDMGDKMGQCFESAMKQTPPPGRGGEREGQPSMPPGPEGMPSSFKGGQPPSEEKMREFKQNMKNEHEREFPGNYHQGTMPPSTGAQLPPQSEMERQSIPPNLILPIMQQESQFSPNTNAPAGGRGIPQMMPQGTPPPQPNTPGSSGNITPMMPVPSAPPAGQTPQPTGPTAPQSSNYNFQDPLKAAIGYFEGIFPNN